MRATRRTFCSRAISFTVTAGLGGPIQAAGDRSAIVDPVKDPRLARRVLVESEGMPVSRVLRALTEATGVKLAAAGRAGDQRLVAFIPTATLADVMLSIADLFRLEWAPDGPKQNAYTLFKSLSASKEEAELRERAIRRAFDDLVGRARAGGLTEKESKETALPEIAKAAPHLLPLVSGNLELLVREGFVYIPMARLPAPVLERLTTLLQPAFDRHNALTKQLQDRLNHDRAAAGQPPLFVGGSDAPPTVARECTLLAECRFKGKPTIWIGLRDPHSTLYAVLESPGDNLEASGQDLLRGKLLWPTSGAAAQVAVPRGAEVDRTVMLPAIPKTADEDWIGHLRRLSSAAQVAIYTDCYPNFEEGMDGHPRGRFQPANVTSVAAALELLCGGRVRGARVPPLHSYWWLFRGAALVRSRRWLWDEETVLPANLILLANYYQAGAVGSVEPS